MATPPTYFFPRGAPVIIRRRVLSGDPTGYTLEADVKPTSNSRIPNASVAAIASFAVTFVPAAGDDTAHWLLTIAAGLPVGQYATDARFVLDGQTAQITQPAFIVITESITA